MEGAVIKLSNLFLIRSRIEIERHRRIKLAIWAYAYEFENVSLVDDYTFDAECRKVNPSIATGKPHLDSFFQTEFHPDTGMWIYNHPEIDKVKRIYGAWIQPRCKH